MGRPFYGLDAPPVVRNLIVAGALGLALWSLAAIHAWSGTIRLPTGHGGVVLILAPGGLAIGITCLAMAAWMIWTSRVGKIRERERLLDTIRWSGTERVLDVGCGRGLLLIGAARRVPRGRAVGIDIWRAADLAANTPEALQANARAEGVSERITVETADMRKLPFADHSFDVVVSRAAIHNLSAAADRAAAIDEIARVLSPGGTVLISDIRHLEEYRGRLAERRIPASVEGSRLQRVLLGLVTLGSLRPGVVRGVRPG